MSTDSFQTVHPPTGEVIHTYSFDSSLQIEKKIESAWQSFHAFKSKSVPTRQKQLRSLAQEFRQSSPSLARLITLEMGKPLKDSEAEIEKCAQGCEYFAENLEAFLKPQELKAHYKSSWVVKDSLGPVLAIMPWNFPLWQTLRFAAPAIGIGNPILLKHSSLTAGTAEKIAEIFDRVEKGLLLNLRLSHEQTAAVIADKRVRAVSLTGSTQAGQVVAGLAGKHLKKTVLELGGSDAYLVFNDAEIEKAAQICAQARMTNNGQSCIAAKRFLIEKKVLPDFLRAFENALANYRPGDPFLSETKVGSLASKKFQKQLLQQCLELEKGGAEKVFDLDKNFEFKESNAYFPARVYRVNREQDQAFQDEFFGPVALIFEFQGEKEALALCNQSPYGLGGAVFSKDLDKAYRVARQMEAGFIAINEQVKSDPRLPFGGVKNSGYGRELSLYGFNEFCNIKSLGFGSGEFSETDFQKAETSPE